MAYWRERRTKPTSFDYTWGTSISTLVILVVTLFIWILNPASTPWTDHERQLIKHKREWTQWLRLISHVFKPFQLFINHEIVLNHDLFDDPWDFLADLQIIFDVENYIWLVLGKKRVFGAKRVFFTIFVENIKAKVAFGRWNCACAERKGDKGPVWGVVCD